HLHGARVGNKKTAEEDKTSSHPLTDFIRHLMNQDASTRPSAHQALNQVQQMLGVRMLKLDLNIDALLDTALASIAEHVCRATKCSVWLRAAVESYDGAVV